MFGQTFNPHDLVVVALLVLLEGVLSIDNALVLGLLAKRLPKHQQKRALTYGLAGAFVFRFIAIGTAAYLLHWRFVKLLGGGYLLWVAINHFFIESRKEGSSIAFDCDHNPALVNGHGIELKPEDCRKEIRARAAMPVPKSEHPGFWSTVLVVELTDIAFAIDSILAAIALVGSVPTGHSGPHPKLWVVITGGMLGVILMRFAAIVFIRLLERFPRFETSAYLLVSVIGLKLIADWAFNTPQHPHMADFHSASSIAFWIFWIAMLLCFAVGFLPEKRETEAAERDC